MDEYEQEKDSRRGVKDDQRLISYDSNGNLLVVKNVKADGLPNPLLNPPYKIKPGFKNK